MALIGTPAPRKLPARTAVRRSRRGRLLGPLLLGGVGRAGRWFTPFAAMTRRVTGILSFALLSACSPAPPAITASDGFDVTAAASRPNAQIATDFMDLAFQLESGQNLPVLTRFEGPVSVRMTGKVPHFANQDLMQLLGRLRGEAGLDMTVVPSDTPARITVEFASHADLRRIEPSAVCFVVPNVASLAEFRARRGSAALDWQALSGRDRMAVFVPHDTSPQEVRDCLHEEIAQALGPVNDLFRLPDSVFNDDNFHTVLTDFDMLVLRLHYAPDLANGMTRAEVAARLPVLLAQMNPAGARPGGWIRSDTPRAWTDAVQTALGPRGSAATRLPAAKRMLSIAQAQGWADNRLGFSWFALGRLLASPDPAKAEQSFRAAAQVYAGLPDGGVHLSHALVHLAALALASGRPDQAMLLADQALPLALRGQNAALQARLFLIKAEALGQLGRDIEARALRLDSLAAAEYGFGQAPSGRAGVVATATPDAARLR